MVTQGMPLQQVVKTLGRNYNAVETKARRLGFKSPIATQTKEVPRLDPLKFGRLPLETVNSGDWIRVGLVGEDRKSVV